MVTYSYRGSLDLLSSTYLSSFAARLSVVGVLFTLFASCLLPRLLRGRRVFVAMFLLAARDVIAGGPQDRFEERMPDSRQCHVVLLFWYELFFVSSVFILILQFESFYLICIIFLIHVYIVLIINFYFSFSYFSRPTSSLTKWKWEMLLWRFYFKQHIFFFFTIILYPVASSDFILSSFYPPILSWLCKIFAKYLY